jgi:hypothetical protein
VLERWAGLLGSKIVSPGQQIAAVLELLECWSAAAGVLLLECWSAAAAGVLAVYCKVP